MSFTLHPTRYGAITRVRVFVGQRLLLSRHGPRLTHVTVSVAGTARERIRILAYDRHGLARTSIRTASRCTKSRPRTRSRLGRRRLART